MGLDTKSGPLIHGQLAESGYEEIASALTPTWQCNSPAQIRGGLEIEMPDVPNQAAINVSGNGGDVPDISPSLNPRGPSGFNGYQFPVAQEGYINIPGGGGVGTNYGSNVGITQSPAFGPPELGDFSVNAAGGLDMSVSMGGMPAASVDGGEMGDGERRPFQFNEPEGGDDEGRRRAGGAGGGEGDFFDPGGGGGGGGDGHDGEDGKDGKNADPCETAKLVCDMMLDGNLCVTGQIETPNGITGAIRWGEVTELIQPNDVGTVTLYGGSPARAEAAQMEPTTENQATSMIDGSASDTDVDDAGNGPDGAENAQDAEDANLDKPPCPDENDPVQPDAEANGDGVGGGREPDNNAVTVVPARARPGEASAATDHGEEGPGPGRVQSPGSSTVTLTKGSGKHKGTPSGPSETQNASGQL